MEFDLVSVLVYKEIFCIRLVFLLDIFESLLSIFKGELNAFAFGILERSESHIEFCLLLKNLYKLDKLRCGKLVIESRISEGLVSSGCNLRSPFDELSNKTSKDFVL